MTTPLRQVPALVAAQKPFKGNSIYAERVGEFYAVFSYGRHFPIAIKRQTVNEPWIVNSERYSVTTSKHQGKVAVGIGDVPRLPATTATLVSLLNGGV